MISNFPSFSNSCLLALLFICLVKEAFSNDEIHIDIQTDFDGKSNWDVDCPSGYSELVSDFDCTDSGKVNFPEEELNGQVGFWTTCEDRCRIKYTVQPGDTSFSARVYQTNLYTEISYDGQNWEYVTGQGWVDIKKEITSGETEISMQLDHLAADYFAVLDRLAVNAELPPIPVDPTTTTTETVETTVSASTTDPTTTENFSSTTEDTTTLGSTSESTSESTPETTPEQTSETTTLETSDTTPFGTSTEGPTESTPETTTTGTTEDTTLETSASTTMTTTFETTTISPTSSASTDIDNTFPTVESSTDIWSTEDSASSPSPPESSTSAGTRPTTTNPGNNSSSKWSDFFKGKWGILLLSFSGAFILTLCVICCARCICINHGGGMRGAARKKKSDLEEILSRRESISNKSSEFDARVGQTTNPTYLNQGYIVNRFANSDSDSIAFQSLYPRAILRESTPYMAFSRNGSTSFQGHEEPNQYSPKHL